MYARFLGEKFMSVCLCTFVYVSSLFFIFYNLICNFQHIDKTYTKVHYLAC